MMKEEFDSIKIGERVGFVFGPGEFPEHNQGTITAKARGDYGFYVDIRMDNGDIERAEGFVKKGIGCYLLGGYK